MIKSRFGFIIAISIFFSVLGCAHPIAEPVEMVTGAQQTDKWLSLLGHKKVAVVVNQTSLVNHVQLVDTMISSGINVIKIFSPEHGLRGQTGAGDAISDTIDAKTGLPVISLYGKKKKPSHGDLNGVDVVVYDIQDVGVRFYTYISTLHYVMEACAENKKTLIVLDRPNPLGHYVDGPVLEPAFQSFVGMHPIPVVYGMTIGELATMINGEGWLTGGIRCDLNVITCVNYNHDSLYHLPVKTSPNLNSMEAVYLYPSLCFFEGTIMSLGRGTDFPFRVYGHPDYPDTAFSFVPRPNTANKAPLYVYQTCYGRNLQGLTAQQLSNIKEINLSRILEAYQAMGSDENFFIPFFDKLAGNSVLRKQLITGTPESGIRESWKPGLEKFLALRAKYLLYDDFK